MQGHHAAVSEEAAEGEQADLIGSAQGSHQAFHPHQITEHPVGTGVTLQLLQRAEERSDMSQFSDDGDQHQAPYMAEY